MGRAMDAIDRAWGYSPLMVRWGRLLYLLAAIGAVWGFLAVHESTSTEDGWLVLLIGCTYGLAVLAMLAGTRYWTVRGLGLLGTLAGDAILYTTLGAATLGWFRTPEWRLDMVRSCFAVGGALMAVSLLVWAVRTRLGTRDEPEGAVV